MLGQLGDNHHPLDGGLWRLLTGHFGPPGNSQIRYLKLTYLLNFTRSGSTNWGRASVSMLFQSQFYVLVFLPVAAALYYSVASSAGARQWVLIGLSLVFYGWWDGRFVALAVCQIAATWLLAHLQERIQSRVPLIIGVTLNLLSLGTFKYLDFLLASIEAATGIVLPRAHIILPIGISFFSFQ